jgi:hypothetical protein
MVESRAPFRVDLTGGYLDVEPYVTAMESVTISAAIDHHVTVTARVSEGRSSFAIVVRGEVVGTVMDTPARELRRVGGGGLFRLLATAANVLGLEVVAEVRLSLPLGIGIGSSGTVAVAALACFAALSGVSGIPPLSLPHLSAGLERICGHEGGVQDQLAAVNGGFRRYDFNGPFMTSTDYTCALPLLRGAVLAIPPIERLGSSDVVAAVLSSNPVDSSGFVTGPIRELRDAGAHLANAIARNPDPESMEIRSAVCQVTEAQLGLHPLVAESASQMPLWPDVHAGRCAAKPLGGGGAGAAWLVLAPDEQDAGRLIAVGWEVAEIAISETGIVTTVK